VRVLVFALLLTDEATLGGRVGEQALEVDVGAAVGADAVFPRLEPAECRFDVAYVADMAIDARDIEVGQRIRHRFVAAVAGLGVELVDAVLVVRVVEFLANFAQQVLVVALEALGELVDLGFRECGHRASWGADCRDIP
jgi:hypothetical protein